MKRTFTRIVSLIIAFLAINLYADAQGCVAVRSGCGANVGGGGILSKGEWSAATNFRYFRSYKHFRGKHEEKARVENGTEVINNSGFMDILLAYGLTERLSVNAALPLVYHHRTSMYEHGGNPTGIDNPNTSFDESTWEGDRRATTAYGLADVRFSASYWLFSPINSKGNVSVGLGFKLPTGEYNAQGTFYNQGANKDTEVKADADQSIQPGDGGVGITLDLQGYMNMSDKLIMTSTLYYLSNPRESFEIMSRNGSTSRRSVPDQYAARLGALYVSSIPGIALYGGGRLEGVPSSDLIGGSEGFRRPGYAISLEPGINYGVRNMSFNLTVPIAVERARTQNFQDKADTRETGERKIGDAAFADYLINFSFAMRFGVKSPYSVEVVPGATN